MTFTELSEQRRKTDIISRFLREQLAQHLETLRPVLAPDRILGRLVGGNAEVPGADRILADLDEKYRNLATPPYDLAPSFEQHWLTLVGNRVELHPWDYSHEAKAGAESRLITVTSPNRWIVNFNANYSVAQLKQAIAGREARRPELVRQFTVNALVLHQVIAKTPGLKLLLTDLRFDLKTELAPGIPRLPLTVISSCLTSSRPADDLILNATALSGIPAFVELIDLEAVNKWEDPLKTRIEQLLGSK